MIENKVEKSGLVNLDLEDFFPEGKRMLIDLKDWLFEGIILREKDFREKVSTHDWSLYKNAFVSVYCSSDAIIPVWAYMLLASRLNESAEVYNGRPDEMETWLFTRSLDKLDIEKFRDKKVLVKGCSNKPVPTAAYLEASRKLLPVVSSLMYGEACSSVPVYKKARSFKEL